MKQLCGIAMNAYFTESGGKLHPNVEMILTTSEPKYRPVEAGDGLQRIEANETVRICAGTTQILVLSKQLHDFAHGVDAGLKQFLLPIPMEAEKE